MADPSAPTICMLMGEHLINHYAGPLARGAVAAAAHLGCRLIIYNPQELNLNQQPVGLADLPLIPRRVDGYVLPSYVSDDVVEYCRRNGAALVTIAGKRPGLPAVSPDNRSGARLVVAHLIGHGRRRIAHLLGIEGNPETIARHAGYRDALEAAGLPYDPALVRVGNFRLGEGRSAVEELLAAGVGFDAIFAANDVSARGALLALAAAGRRVPADVAVVGFDDSAGSESLDPPLTTLRQSAFQIGWNAVSVLTRRGSATLSEDVTVATQLIIRRSCGCRNQIQAPEDWASQLAVAFGVGQGPIVDPAEVRTLLAPLDQHLDQPDAWAHRFEQITIEGYARSWHVPALRSFLWGWQKRLEATGADPVRLAELRATAIDILDRTREEWFGRYQRGREDRMISLAYLVDLLRGNPRDQAHTVAMRFLVDCGARSALNVVTVPGDLLGVQRVTLNGIQRWLGSAASFPPQEWIDPGDTLLVMPISDDQQQPTLVGIVEHAARDHIDLDDLLLRTINTYRTVSLFNDTLRELEIARSVQHNLLPRSVPVYPGYRIAGASQTARQVGGDLYSYHRRPGGGLALALGDVAGKGMPAALLMSACVTALAGMIQADLSPGRTLSQMHQVIEPYVGQGQNTAVCLVYLDGDQMRCANAGGVAPLIRSKDGVRLLEIGGLPLGTPLSTHRPYLELELTLAPGEMLVLCSDGIVEAVNTQRELYGFERFAAAIAAGPADDAQALLGHIFADVAAFIGDTELHDDMTLVVVQHV